MKAHVDNSDPAVMAYMESISEKLSGLHASNMEFNSSQQIRDRIGQQKYKIIPSIKTFHDQLVKIGNKLSLNWNHIEPGDTHSTKVGYGGVEKRERVQQADVNDLLSSLEL